MSNLHESFTMSQLFTTGFHDQAVAAAAIAHSAGASSGPLYQAKMLLFTNHITPTKGTALADLTECTFSGYAESAAIVVPPPVRNPDGSYDVIVPSQVFQAATATPFVGETALGAALIDSSTPPNLLACGVFDNPVDLSVVGNGVAVTMNLNYGGPQENSSIETSV